MIFLAQSKENKEAKYNPRNKSAYGNPESSRFFALNSPANSSAGRVSSKKRSGEEGKINL
jgi:hypothetical protein